MFIIALVTVLALSPINPFSLLDSNARPEIDPRTAYSYGAKVPIGSKTVAIGGGGAVTGIYIHPRRRNLIYLRTDIGGYYRWNSTTEEWIPLTDQFSYSDRNYYGGESLALDPTDSNIVYIAVGKSQALGQGTLLKSSDRGDTWTKLDLDLPLPKDKYRRWIGERLAVNPFNPQALLFGSWRSGLWRSQDGGATWTQAAPLFSGKPDADLAAILYDPQRSGRVYATVDGEGVYESTDAGATWRKLVNSPKRVMRMAIAPDQSLYNTGSEKPLVSKYAGGTWKDISPPGAEPVFNGISINPANSRDLLVMRGETGDPELYRSQDGGATWKELSRETKSTVSWWTEPMRQMSGVAAIAFDPYVPDRVWLVDEYGIWRTDNLNADRALWTNYQKGHEEGVVFTLAAPPKGAILVSGLADVDGFVHNKGLDEYPSKSFSSTGVPFQDTYSIAYSETDPLKMVRVGGSRSDGKFGGATSSDGGLTWQKFKSFPLDVKPTRVAMSATIPDLFIITISKGQPIRSSDNGKTWATVAGLPDGAKGPWNLPPRSLVADSVDGNTFYYYSDGTVYRSSDGGKLFKPMTDKLPRQTRHTLQTIPGKQGEVWLGLDEDGLRRSQDGGKTFTAIASVEQAFLFDFGAPKPGSTIPALYLFGKVSGQDEGTFRSLDWGTTWTRINAPKRPIGSDPTVLSASRQKFGLVFLGTSGRGIFYGSVQ